MNSTLQNNWAKVHRDKAAYVHREAHVHLNHSELNERHPTDQKEHYQPSLESQISHEYDSSRQNLLEIGQQIVTVNATSKQARAQIWEETRKTSQKFANIILIMLQLRREIAQVQPTLQNY